MSEKPKLIQMLEHLDNQNMELADQLFHEFIVAKSREIYEALLESELDEEDCVECGEDDDDQLEGYDIVEGEDEDDQDDFDFGDDEDEKDTSDDQDFDGDDFEGDDEENDDTDQEGTDDDLENQVYDLEDKLAELEAKFAELSGKSNDDFDSDDMEGDIEPTSDEETDDFSHDIDDDDEDKSFEEELATIREFISPTKIPSSDYAKKSEQSGTNTKSIVAGKNDMGGDAGNIAQGETADQTKTVKKPQVKDFANKNTVNAKQKLEKVSAPKAKDEAGNKQSIFRGKK